MSHKSCKDVLQIIPILQICIMTAVLGCGMAT